MGSLFGQVRLALECKTAPTGSAEKYRSLELEVPKAKNVRIVLIAVRDSTSLE